MVFTTFSNHSQRQQYVTFRAFRFGISRTASVGFLNERETLSPQTPNP